jgi:hypothetical protein
MAAAVELTYHAATAITMAAEKQKPDTTREQEDMETERSRDASEALRYPKF